MELQNDRTLDHINIDYINRIESNFARAPSIENHRDNMNYRSRLYNDNQYILMSSSTYDLSES